MSSAANAYVNPLTTRDLLRLGRAVPRRLYFTRQGKLLFGVTLFVGFAAINSGNNLLYLVLGVLLSLILISGVLSEITLRGLTAFRYETPDLVADEAALVRIELKNTKRNFSSFSVEVSELVGPEIRLEQRPGFVLSIAPGQNVSAYLRVQCPERGVSRTAGLQVTTRFPFGFFEKSRIIPLPGEYVVFPAVNYPGQASSHTITEGLDDEEPIVGQGEEFYGLREERRGDDARIIAWKVTARRDQVIVREFQRPATRQVLLQVPNILYQGTPLNQQVLRVELESAISDAAGYAKKLIDEGFSVGVCTFDGIVEPGIGVEHLRNLHRHLALAPLRSLELGETPPVFPTLSRRNVERIGVLTASQQKHGLSLDFDRVLVTGDKGAQTAAEPPKDESGQVSG